MGVSVILDCVSPSLCLKYECVECGKFESIKIWIFKVLFFFKSPNPKKGSNWYQKMQFGRSLTFLSFSSAFLLSNFSTCLRLSHPSRLSHDWNSVWLHSVHYPRSLAVPVWLVPHWFIHMQTVRGVLIHQTRSSILVDPGTSVLDKDAAFTDSQILN